MTLPLPSSAPYLDTLNAAQRQAALCTEGPLLILAGAGTGKTRVLISRMAHIIQSQLAWPSQVLAVTFTNKAAQEMRTRTEDLLGQSVAGLWIGTFHSLCARILRPHASLLGFSERFTIIDSDDQLRTMRQIIKSQGLDDRKEAAKIAIGLIERWKDRALTPNQVPRSELHDDFMRQTHMLYELYEARLQALDAVDFGNLLIFVIKLMQEHPDILAKYQSQWRYIMVDEYQDTNIAQYIWLRLIAQKHKNICCVGDDDQSIYGWRGAEVGNILRFDHDFQGATVVKLEQNYRSTTHILGAASGIIHHNKERHIKTLWTDLEGGDKVFIKSTWDSREEARFVAEEIENLQRRGHSLNHMAILVRAGFQTREFEECFMNLAVSYRIVGGQRFYDRQEIRDAVAYIRLLANPQDGLAFERIVNVPKRGIGPSTLSVIHTYARAQSIPPLASTSILLQSDEIRGKAKTTLQHLLNSLQQWRSLLDVEPPAKVVQQMLQESGYIKMWKDDKSPDAPGRIENLKELVNAVGEFETLADFVDHVSLVMDKTLQTNEDMITIMTMHGAKGLEFDTVFLTGWEEGIFPSQRSMDQRDAMEEERRLAYVGLTRAKNRAYISFAANRHFYGQWQNNPPSRFINELPEDHVEWLPSAFQRPRTGHAPSQTYSPYQNLPFDLGSRVFHLKFGYGRVMDVDDQAALVAFDHGGTKRVIHQFLNKS